MILFGLFIHLPLLLPWLTAIGFTAIGFSVFISEKDPYTMFCCRAILFLIALPQSVLLYRMFSEEPLAAAVVLMVQYIMLYFVVAVLYDINKKLLSFAEKRHFHFPRLCRMMLILLHSLVLLILYVAGLVSYFQFR